MASVGSHHGQGVRAGIARDISYAHGAATRGGRAVIRVLENTTGRLKLIRRAAGYDADIARGGDFWQVICDRYDLRLDVVGGALSNIPATGPLVLVANHPYGILDGLMMGRILSQARGGDFRVLAHRIFRKSPDLERVILPISFDDTKEAVATNLATRTEALRYLSAGGAIGIFPGGTVSTGARPFDPPMDPGWRTFTAKMIARSGATVVPVFFEGQNSRLFQIASHLHANLRVGLLIREFRTRIGRPCRVVIGQPIAPETLTLYRNDARAMMDFLRRATYELSPKPLDPARMGYEFEGRHKAKARIGADGGGNL